MRTVFLAMVCLIVSSQALLAQAPAAPGNYQFFVKATADPIGPNSDTTSFSMVYPLETIMGDPIYITGQNDLIINVTLSDTNSIDTIHLNVGITKDGSEVHQLAIPFDPVSTPASYQYVRQGASLTLTLDSLNQGEYYPYLFVEDNLGVHSDTLCPANIQFINL